MPRRLPRPVALETGPLAHAEGDGWAALSRQGFGLSDARIAHLRAGLGDHEIRVARQGGALAGTAALMPMRQWFGGRPVAAVGIAAVTVAAAERGRGVAAALLRSLLEEARQRGLAFALLHAATLPLYHRLGFARAGVCVDYQLSVRRTLGPLADPARREPVRFSPLPDRDPAPLAALRTRQAPRCNGMLERPPLLWANLLSPADEDPPEALLIQGDHGPQGYLVLHPPAENRLRIADICLLRGGAARQGLSCRAGPPGRAETVLWPGGPDDPLVHLAPEVEVDIDDWELWLGRVVDVPAALAARGYPAGLSARLDLEVEDSVLAANHRRWRLAVVDGLASVTAPASADGAVPSLRLPVSALAPLLTGHLGAGALAAMGVIDGCNAAVSIAGWLFGGPSPWLADRF